MTKERLRGNMSIQDAMMELADRNPGALTVLMKLLDTTPEIDPYAIGPAVLLNVDSMGLRGSQIWDLYKNVCKQDIEKTATIIRGWQLGLVSKAAIHEAVDSYGSKVSFDVDDIVRKVQSQIPGYKKIVPDSPSAAKGATNDPKLER